MEPLLQAVGLEKRFGVVRALDGFSLDVRAGEILGLVGQNGAGKSTFVRTLAGLEHADGGELMVDGTRAGIGSPRAAERLGFSFVHQQLALIASQTVEENLFLAAPAPKRLGLVSTRRSVAAARALLAQFDLDIDPRARVTNLSIANRWMLAIAKALLRRSRLLVLDEPTSSLSAREVDQLFAAVRRLRDQGVAIIYISHRLSEIETLVDRIAVCKDGRVVGVVAPKDVSRRELIRMMVGREITEFAIAARARSDDEPVLEAIGVRGRGVDDVSLSVRAGEIVGLAGLIGAGRTETAEMLIGHRPLEGGSIQIKGAAYRPRSPIDGIRRGVVLVPEERADSLFMTRAIGDNISIAILERLRLARWAPFISSKRVRRVADEQMRALDVKARNASQRVAELSGGNQQKVVLARWLVRGADVFIFDEPTRGIDVQGKQQIYLLMDELAKAGAGVIFISSELPELIAISHRMVVIRERRSVGELPRGSTEEQVLSMCYGQPEEEA